MTEWNVTLIVVVIALGMMLSPRVMEKRLFTRRMTHGHEESDGAPKAKSSPWGLGAGLLVVAVVAMSLVSLPSYRDYSNRAKVTPHVVSVALEEALAETQDEDARRSLARASSEIDQVAEILRRPNWEADESSREEIQFGIRQAMESVALASRASTSEQDATRVRSIQKSLWELERGLRATESESTTGNVEATKLDLSVLVVVGGSFLVVLLAIYGFVVWRHGAEDPAKVRKRLHVLLQPVVSLGVIAIGISLGVAPDVSAETATWGVGVAGSGIGYWIGSVTK